MSLFDSFSLLDKTAVITGSGQGIGLAIAKGLHSVGATVVGVDRLFSTTDFFQTILTIDFFDQEASLSQLNKFCDSSKAIDIWINCAGMTQSQSSELYSNKNWDNTLQINLTTAFQCCQIAGNSMIRHGIPGSIINVTSIGDCMGFPNNPAYCASKGGLNQLTKALASDWGKHQIRVNNLAPGYTNTPMNKRSFSDKDMKQARADRTFLNRWAEPEDMVGPAIFLASEASAYVTGTTLYVDGGWTAKGL